jgi:heme-degrading monooxygenase HmoA
MRLPTLVGALSLLLMAGACTSHSDNAAAQKATDPVVIVVPYTIEPGKSEADALRAIQAISAEIKTHHGFVDARLLKESLPNVQPQYLHVTRWHALDDWSALSASPKFQSVLDKSLPSVRVNLAQVYKPVQ